MNKSDLKNFAINARLELLRRVSDRAALYGISEKAVKDKSVVPSAAFHKIDGTPLTASESERRNALIVRASQIGYRPAMEEAAYTWFNRFVALKYLQEHNLLPVAMRVLPDAPGVQPQILREAQDVSLPNVNLGEILSMLDGNRTDELYKYLLLKLCAALSETLPGMFREISGATELLFPDGLLRADSVLGEMAKLDADCWSEIQVVGWLYQYYISQRHDEVVDINGSAIPKEDIPAATCLYTPDWVVRYMVENSLGRLWLEGHPSESLRASWRYFMDEAEQTPEVAAKLSELRASCASLQPEAITVLDPCMGSGHILVYAFDVLMQIYRSVGYTDRDAVQSIVENNLYGLDIDDRAAQLAYFAVMMKACEYDRRFLRRGVQPHVCAIQESAPVDAPSLSALGAEEPLAERLMQNFTDAKEYGSILRVNLSDGELARLSARLDALESAAHENLLAMADGAQVVQVLRPLVNQAQILNRKYDIVITNPPYMNKFSKDLKKYVLDNYADFKADLFSVFMHRNFDFCKANGYTSFMTPFVWMFIKSYEKLREEIIQRKCITTLIQMEYSAFEEATVPICTFVLRNSQLNYAGNYLRLSDFKGGMDVQNDMVLKAQKSVNCSYRYAAQQDNFKKIPGSPIAYWVSERVFNCFLRNSNLYSKAPTKMGLTTGDNNRFLRMWFEIGREGIGKKYFFYNKGGDFRKWYGNLLNVIDWENNGYEVRNFKGATIRNDGYYFKKCISWGLITTSKSSFRSNEGYSCVFGDAGPGCFPCESDFDYTISCLNSKVVELFLTIMNPTINLSSGIVSEIPFIISEKEKEKVDGMARKNITISKTDWDSFETSWDFKKHPLI